MYTKKYLIHVARSLYELIIKRASPIWGTPLFIYFSLAIPKLIGFTPELNMRVAGFILQLSFVIIVLIDLYKLSQEEEFDIPKIRDRIKKWLIEFREIFKKSVTVSESITEGIGIGENFKVHADFNLYEDDVEKNLHLLASKIKSLKKRTDDKFEAIEKKLGLLDSQIQDEVDKREEEIKEFKGFFKRITTNGFIPEIVGLIWLISGLLFSIFPSESSGVMNCFIFEFSTLTALFSTLAQ